MTETYSANELPRQMGAVIAFVSPKGGTGKTVIAATTAYLLCRVGKKVIAIDADFSTRGLSLYLVGSTDDIDPQDQNCLAEIILKGIPVQKIEPRRIMRDGLIGGEPINLILSNQDLWRGGRPDGDFTSGDVSVKHYFEALREICNWLRQNYDYVIVDTRGGYDFSSAVPAVVADRYIIIMEPDKVSIDQVFGFQKSIAEFAEEKKIRPKLSGFIINKATFSPQNDTVAQGLYSLFGVRTLGVIPADNDCIRAYQTKEIPSEKYTFSDFSYYATLAVERMVNPDHNWDKTTMYRWRLLRSRVHSAWAARVWLRRFQELALIGQAILVFATIGIGAWFLRGDSAVLELTTYIGLCLSAYWVIVATGLRVQQQLLLGGSSRNVRIGAFAAGAAILLVLPGVLSLGGVKLWDRRITRDAKDKENIELITTLSSNLERLTNVNGELRTFKDRVSKLRIDQHRFGVGQPNGGGGIEWLACGYNPSTRMNELCPDQTNTTVLRSLVPVGRRDGGQCGFDEYVATCVIY